MSLTEAVIEGTIQPDGTLVLDEPTNDLDIETLALLEELLVDFEGTVLVVSHDREFLDNVATSTLAIGPDGVVEEFVGGWSDWKRQDLARQEVKAKEAAKRPVQMGPMMPVAAAEKPRRKLSFKENQELLALPKRIEQLEAEQLTLVESMGTADFYRRAPGEIAATKAKQTELETMLAQTYARWEELAGLAEG